MLNSVRGPPIGVLLSSKGKTENIEWIATTVKQVALECPSQSHSHS